MLDGLNLDGSIWDYEFPATKVAASSRFLAMLQEGAGKITLDAARGRVGIIKPTTSWAASPYGTSLVNASGGVDFGNPPNISSIANQCTVWALIRPTTPAGGYQEIIGRTDGTNSQSFELRMLGFTGTLQWLVKAGGSVGTVNGVATLTAGLWYLVAGVYTGGAIQIWINGKLDATAAKTGALSTGDGYNLFLGCRQTNDLFLLGQIAAAGVHDKAMTQADMIELMQMLDQSDTLKPVSIYGAYEITGGSTAVTVNEYTEYFTVTPFGGNTFNGTDTITIASTGGQIFATAPTGSAWISDSNEVGNGSDSVLVTPLNGDAYFTVRAKWATTGTKSIVWSDGQGWSDPAASSVEVTSGRKNRAIFMGQDNSRRLIFRNNRGSRSL